VKSAALGFQNVPPAPGREGVVSQPATPAAGTGASESPSSGFAFLPMLVMVVPLLLLMFWTSRSQSKKQATMLSGLAKGDRVLLQSGIVGKFIEMNDRIAKIEISPGVKIDVLRSALAGKDNLETQQVVADKAAAEKK
jgi:preprotein translocase subunit YajC